MYKGAQKPGPGSSAARNKERRKSKNQKKKSDTNEFVGQVAVGEEKSKETYCIRCGDP